MPDRTTTELGESVLDAVGVAFSRLRRRTMQVEVDPAVTSKDLTRNLVINLVDESDGMLTVGDVGHQLGVSPSVASRMVSDCIDAGLVLRVASQRDGRRSTLSLTPEGESRREIFRQQYRQAFEQITIDWPRSEQLEFARLLLKYADATSALPQAMTRSVPSRTSHAGPIEDARTSAPPHGGRDNQSHPHEGGLRHRNEVPGTNLPVSGPSRGGEAWPSTATVATKADLPKLSPA